LPQYVQSDFPRFIDFLEKYYEWMEIRGNALGLSKDLPRLQDLDTTEDPFLHSLQKEVMSRFPKELYVDPANPNNRVKIQNAIKNIVQFYGAKGTERAYKYLFRLILGAEIDFYYPRVDMLRPSDGKWIQNYSVRVEMPTNSADTPFAFINKKIIGQNSQSSAFVEYAIKLEIGLNVVYELFLNRSSITGEFYPGEILYSDEAPNVFANPVTCVTGFKLFDKGSNYSIGTEIASNFQNFNIQDFKATVSTVNTLGNVTKVDIVSPGFKIPPTAFSEVKIGERTYNNILVYEPDGDNQLHIIPQVGTIIKYKGYFLNDDGKLSDAKFIQDSFYYQQFSYVIKVSESFDFYESFVKDLIHPSGLKLFGNFLSENFISSGAKVQNNLQITWHNEVEYNDISFKPLDVELKLEVDPNIQPELDEYQLESLVRYRNGASLNSIDRFKFTYKPNGGNDEDRLLYSGNSNYWKTDFANYQIKDFFDIIVGDFWMKPWLRTKIQPEPILKDPLCDTASPFPSGSKQLFTINIHTQEIFGTPSILSGATSILTSSISTGEAFGSLTQIEVVPDSVVYGLGNSGSGEIVSSGGYVTIAKSFNSIDEWTDVFAGERITFLLKPNKTLWAMGSQQYSMGDGASTSWPEQGAAVNPPIPIESGDTWKQVSHWAWFGDNFAHAIKEDGTLWGAGWVSGLLNNLWAGTSTATPWYFAQIGSESNWRSISTTNWTFGLKTDGTLYHWGYPPAGLSGWLGTITQVGTDTNWSKIVSGLWHCIALKTDGTLWGWGNNDYGQLTGTSNSYGATPSQIGTANDWIDIHAGENFTIAIKSDGTLWGCGINSVGQCGAGQGVGTSGPYGYLIVTSLTQIGTDTDWASLGECHGRSGTLAIKTDGSLWGWGNNNDYQLGRINGTFGNSPVFTPTRLLTPNIPIVKASMGALHTMFLVDSDVPWQGVISSGIESGEAFGQTQLLGSNGLLYTWGDARYGVLGNGTYQTDALDDDVLSPTVISSGVKWKDISVGSQHMIALKLDGTLWSWGLNTNGQLGKGTTTNNNANGTPVQIGSDSNWISVSAGDNHSLAIKSNGTIWAWGAGSSGRLGVGDTTGRTSPTQIGSDSNWISVSGGSLHTLAIKSNGTLYAWGSNINGRLGDGTTTQRNSPVQIGSDTNWMKVSAGNSHTVALKNDGTLWTWGYNAQGQLGDGTTIQKTSPIQIGTDTNWKEIYAGYQYTFAIKNNGTLWAWGWNNYRVFGNGTTTDSLVPIQIGSDTNWRLIEGRDLSTFAIKTDGTLWAAGTDNAESPLGFGISQNTTILTFTQIGTDTDWLLISGGGQGQAAAIKRN
jgi:alpha-tubulin suppressor-like RCC1 family protein